MPYRAIGRGILRARLGGPRASSERTRISFPLSARPTPRLPLTRQKAKTLLASPETLHADLRAAEAALAALADAPLAEQLAPALAVYTARSALVKPTSTPAVHSADEHAFLAALAPGEQAR